MKKVVAIFLTFLLLSCDQVPLVSQKVDAPAQPFPDASVTEPEIEISTDEQKVENFIQSVDRKDPAGADPNLTGTWVRAKAASGSLLDNGNNPIGQFETFDYDVLYFRDDGINTIEVYECFSKNTWSFTYDENNAIARSEDGSEIAGEIGAWDTINIRKYPINEKLTRSNVEYVKDGNQVEKILKVSNIEEDTVGYLYMTLPEDTGDRTLEYDVNCSIYGEENFYIGSENNFDNYFFFKDPSCCSEGGYASELRGDTSIHRDLADIYMYIDDRNFEEFVLIEYSFGEGRDFLFE